jgi:hypothetical protein
MGASPMLLLVTQTARTSIVSSSIPMCILRQMRQMRRLGPPVARQHMLACVRGMLAGVPLAFTFGFDGVPSHSRLVLLKVVLDISGTGDQFRRTVSAKCSEWQSARHQAVALISLNLCCATRQTLTWR